MFVSFWRVMKCLNDINRYLILVYIILVFSSLLGFGKVVEDLM